MIKLNNKQREEIAKSLMKLAEYTALTLVIGQLALGKLNLFTLSLAALTTIIIYLFSLYLLRKYEEVY